MSDYYDRQGRRIGLMKWVRLFEDLKYRVLVQDHVNDITVSTVWLGLDHNMWGGPPLIFESMVFNTADFDHQWASLEMRRYSTEAEAFAGHRELLEVVNLLELTDTETGEAHE
jgi:hypothetical protein